MNDHPLKPEAQHLHTTVTGHELRYAARPAVDAFLARLRRMLEDSTVTERDMVALGYAAENPLLARVPGDVASDRGFVNAEVLADPAYRVMNDLIARKRLTELGTDVEALAATFSVSTSEAAASAGVSESAIRQAITSGRLASWVKGGRHYMHPDAVARFAERAAQEAAAGSRRGTRAAAPAPEPAAAPAAPLSVCVGHGEGASFRVKYPLELQGEARVKGNWVSGSVPVWSRVAVLSGAKRARFFELEPAPGEPEQEIAHQGGHVRGCFRVVATVHDSDEARARFRAFVPK